MSDPPLTRYTLRDDGIVLARMEGEWVKWAEVEPLLRELEEAKAERDTGRAALAAARDVLVAFAKQAGYLPEQGGYSTRMTEAERQLARAVGDIDMILAANCLAEARDE